MRDPGGRGIRTPSQRRQDFQEASESGSKTEAEGEERNEEGYRDGETPREAMVGGPAQFWKNSKTNLK